MIVSYIMRVEYLIAFAADNFSVEQLIARRVPQ